MKVLIMGLGLHGGGLESAKHLLRQGAELTVTDLRDEQTLAPTIRQLEAACEINTKKTAIRYVLGKHEIADFKNADMVIKNPGVHPDSPFLQVAKNIETDISLFLAAMGTTIGEVRLTAVTGTKGKSSTASALHWVLTHAKKKMKDSGQAYLGGNITVSPLVFLDDLSESDDVVLELSSFQLGDLRATTGWHAARRRRDRHTAGGKMLLKPKAAVLTAIMEDHLDRYGSMENYINDKRVIYQGQDSGDLTVAGDDSWGKSFLSESKAQPLVYSSAGLPDGVCGGWFNNHDSPGFARINGAAVEIVPAQPLVPGRHQKQTLLAAGLALLGLGLPHEIVWEGIASYPGIAHRLEHFHKAKGIDFYNDSAATIPQAAAAALEALSDEGKRQVVLVTGGTDKNLDFSPLVAAAGKAKAIILLAGSGSEKLRTLLTGAHIGCHGPFDSLDKAVTAALETAAPGDCVVLSPGCASFGMFLNEFDRGNRWKEMVRRLAG